MAYKTISKKQQGYTLTELIIVIAIIIIIAAAAAPFYLNFYYRQQLDSSANEIIQTLRKAQIKAKAGENNHNFGIYFGQFGADGSYFFDLFEEGVDNTKPADQTVCEADSNGDCYVLPAGLEISQYKLNGQDNVTFAKYSGQSNLPNEAWIRIANKGADNLPKVIKGGILNPPENVTVAVCKIKQPDTPLCGTDEYCKAYNPVAPDDCCCTSLYDWNAKRARDLTQQGSGQIEVAQIEGDWTYPETGFGIDLNSSVWTTSANNYIKIYTVGNARHSGVWNDNQYRLQQTAQYIPAFYLETPYATIEGLQIFANMYTAAAINASGNGQYNILSNIIKGANKAGAQGIYLSASAQANIWNNIIYNFSGNNNYGIKSNSIASIFNNTLANNTIGIFGSVETTIVNNLIYGADAYDGSFSWASYNITYANECPTGFTNLVPPPDCLNNNKKNQDLISAFINLATNFHLKSGDDKAKEKGSDLSAYFSKDIDDQKRPSNNLWDAGADESLGQQASDCPLSKRQAVTITISTLGKIDRCQ